MVKWLILLSWFGMTAPLSVMAQNPTTIDPVFTPPDRCKVEGEALPPPDCIIVLNPPSMGGGVFIDKTINIDGSIFLNLPKEGLSTLGAPTLSPQVLVPELNGLGSIER